MMVAGQLLVSFDDKSASKETLETMLAGSLVELRRRGELVDMVGDAMAHGSPGVQSAFVELARLVSRVIYEGDDQGERKRA